MNKLDFISQDKVLYQAKKEPELIEVPIMQYLMFDGRGKPEGNPEFQQAFNALYGIAYLIKFMPRRGDHPLGYIDFKVPPPEGLWWTSEDKDLSDAKPENWRWTLMIRMPDFVTEGVVDTAIAELSIKKKSDIYWRVRLDNLEEGMAVQMMYIGPYDKEQAALAQMDAFTTAGGLHYSGKHHEIYFSDPRRTKAENLKTLLRHPVTHLVA